MKGLEPSPAKTWPNLSVIRADYRLYWSTLDSGERYGYGKGDGGGDAKLRWDQQSLVAGYAVAASSASPSRTNRVAPTER